MKERNSIFQQTELGTVPFATFGVAASFSHPDDVASDRRLTRAEKRAILASWCSDARAVENAPKLRRLESGAVVEVDAILRALASLDGPATRAKPSSNWLPFRQRRSGGVSRWLSRARSSNGANDNDDDPPPAPAGIAFPFRPSYVVAHAADPEVLGGATCAAACR